MNPKYSLNGAWNLHFYDGAQYTVKTPSALHQNPKVTTIFCNVPCNVEPALSDAGYLPKDLFFGTHILDAISYETYDFWFEKTFDAPEIKEDQKLVLSFGGVDCYAEYFLNGQKIGESRNMFLPVSFDITHLVKKAENRLYVHISSAVIAENDMPVDLNTMYQSWRTYSLSSMTRKAAHSYGWDIMPRAVSAGIWRDVNLEIRNTCEFSQLYFVTDRLSEESAAVFMLYDIALPHRYVNKDLELTVTLRCGEQSHSFCRAIPFKSGKLRIDVPNPALWWPYGYGAPNLYHAKMTLSAEGAVIAETETDFGIRTVKLIRKDTVSETENNFRFQINGTDIVCKGLNWVPLDVYHSRDKARYPKVFELVKDIGCNMLRCWGGNVYEEKEFFDFCDQNGIMVWQDFAMACFNYPQTDAFMNEIAREAEVIIKQLRQHPSLVLWAGDNECDLLQLSIGNGVSPGCNRITREVLPHVIFNHDKGRPYLESSPYISDRVYEEKRFKQCAEDHLWGVRDYFKNDYYRSSKAHFVSETGYHGCPSPTSIKKFIDEKSLWPFHKNNQQWILHSTDMNGDPSRTLLMEKQIRQYFGFCAESLEDFSLASQISQAEADKYFIERVRLKSPKSGGVILWNLIDGWPEFSDALVDYYFEKKLAYDVAKRCFSPFTFLCGEIENLLLPIYAVNDTLTAKTGHLTVSDGDSNEILWETDYRIEENTTRCIGKIPMNYSDKKLLLLRWDQGFHHHICGMIPFDFAQCKAWYETIQKQENENKQPML